MIWFYKVLGCIIPNFVNQAVREELTLDQTGERLEAHLEHHHENWLDDAFERFEKLFQVHLHLEDDWPNGFEEHPDVHALLYSGALFDEHDKWNTIQTTTLATVTINLTYWEKDEDYWAKSLVRPVFFSPFERALEKARAEANASNYLLRPSDRDLSREIAKRVFTWP